MAKIITHRQPASVGFSRLPICHQLELVEAGNVSIILAGFSRLSRKWF
jgi:hypothetical protein